MAEQIADDTIEVLAVIGGKPWKYVRVKTSSTELRVPYFESLGWERGEPAPKFGHHILKPTGEKDEYGTPIWSSGNEAVTP